MDFETWQRTGQGTAVPQSTVQKIERPYERRLMQGMMFGYLGTLIYCVVSFLITEKVSMFQPALWVWSAIFGLFGLRLIITRIGWVPARRGARIVQGKIATFLGALYVIFAAGLATLGFLLPTIFAGAMSV